MAKESAANQITNYLLTHGPQLLPQLAEKQKETFEQIVNRDDDIAFNDSQGLVYLRETESKCFGIFSKNCSGWLPISSIANKLHDTCGSEKSGYLFLKHKPKEKLEEACVEYFFRQRGTVIWGDRVYLDQPYPAPSTSDYKLLQQGFQATTNLENMTHRFSSYGNSSSSPKEVNWSKLVKRNPIFYRTHKGTVSYTNCVTVFELDKKGTLIPSSTCANSASVKQISEYLTKIYILSRLREQPNESATLSRLLHLLSRSEAPAQIAASNLATPNDLKVFLNAHCSSCVLKGLGKDGASVQLLRNAEWEALCLQVVQVVQEKYKATEKRLIPHLEVSSQETYKEEELEDFIEVVNKRKKAARRLSTSSSSSSQNAYFSQKNKHLQQQKTRTRRSSYNSPQTSGVPYKNGGSRRILFKEKKEPYKTRKDHFQHPQSKYPVVITNRRTGSNVVKHQTDSFPDYVSHTDPIRPTQSHTTLHGKADATGANNVQPRPVHTRPSYRPLQNPNGAAPVSASLNNGLVLSGYNTKHNLRQHPSKTSDNSGQGGPQAPSSLMHANDQYKSILPKAQAVNCFRDEISPGLSKSDKIQGGRPSSFPSHIYNNDDQSRPTTSTTPAKDPYAMSEPFPSFERHTSPTHLTGSRTRQKKPASNCPVAYPFVPIKQNSVPTEMQSNGLNSLEFTVPEIMPDQQTSSKIDLLVDALQEKSPVHVNLLFLICQRKRAIFHSINSLAQEVVTERRLILENNCWVKLAA